MGYSRETGIGKQWAVVSNQHRPRHRCRLQIALYFSRVARRVNLAMSVIIYKLVLQIPIQKNMPNPNLPGAQLWIVSVEQICYEHNCNTGRIRGSRRWRGQLAVKCFAHGTQMHASARTGLEPSTNLLTRWPLRHGVEGSTYNLLLIWFRQRQATRSRPVDRNIYRLI